jgi:C4-dicarboxylate-specific signal transduction histidine kinase
MGVLAVQSYDPTESYADQDKELLTFVARQVSTTIQRRQDKLALQRAHNELESRVIERTAELNQTNKELRTTLSKLETAQGQLVESEKMASLGNLVAGIAHEINTPLGVAVTAASHLEERVSSLCKDETTDSAMLLFAERAKTATSLVLDNLRRAAQLVSSFKQVAADQSTSDRRQFSVRDYLDEILISLYPKIRRSGHKIELRCADDIEVDGYPSALYQIVSNLIMNSMIHAFHPETVGQMSLDVTATESDFELVYRDNGRGLTADEGRHLFEPFYTTRRGKGGTGLGMHIAYNNVIQLGGKIEFESQPGQGVKFVITLPRNAREIAKAQFMGQA